jgi:surface antigen
MIRKFMLTGLALLPLIGCAQPGDPNYAGPGEIGLNKTTGGTLLGAAAGGLVGSQFGGGAGKGILTGLGVVLGGVLGNEAGRSLDRADQIQAEQATQRALETAPSGQVQAWRNPDNGNSGTITPKPAYRAPDGRYCREYQQTIIVGGEARQAYGTACRQPDGTWKIVS